MVTYGTRKIFGSFEIIRKKLEESGRTCCYENKHSSKVTCSKVLCEHYQEHDDYGGILGPNLTRGIGKFEEACLDLKICGQAFRKLGNGRLGDS